MGNKGNFLSRMIEEEKREHVRREMNAPCKIAYLKGGMRGYNTLVGLILNISEGGAFLKLPVPLQRGQDIYLMLQNFPFKVAGVVIAQSEKGCNIKFANLIPEKSIHQIASGRPYVKPKAPPALKPAGHR